MVATLEMASAILLEAALSFLGLGVQPPLPSWGLMISEAKSYMFFSAWLITIPGVALLAARARHQPARRRHPRRDRTGGEKLMSREQAIARAERYFDDGGFLDDLARRVAIRTESQDPERRADLARYLTGEMQPSFERLGFRCRIIDNPAPGGGPFLVAERHRGPRGCRRCFCYGHGDVIRGQEAQWRAGPRSVDADASRASGSTAAAPPTTRGSTRSTWRRSTR